VSVPSPGMASDACDRGARASICWVLKLVLENVVAGSESFSTSPRRSLKIERDIGVLAPGQMFEDRQNVPAGLSVSMDIDRVRHRLDSSKTGSAPHIPRDQLHRGLGNMGIEGQHRAPASPNIATLSMPERLIVKAGPKYGSA